MTLTTVAVDIVVFGLDLGRRKRRRLRVLMIHRLGPPYVGELALPGGRVESHEDTATAARRELLEETGIEPDFLEQLYTFSAPNRDPRGRVISVAYYALVNVEKFVPVAGTDAKDSKWYDLEKVLNQPLAFDHAEILRVAVERLRGKIRYAPLGFDLLPKHFTIPELRQVYETVLGVSLEPANFRRALLKTGLLIATKTVRPTTTKPAALFQFDEEKYKALTQKGWNFEIF